MYVQEKQRSNGTASTAVSAKTKLAKAAASATAVSGPKNTVSWGKFREQAAIVYIAEQGTVTGRGSLK